MAVVLGGIVLVGSCPDTVWVELKLWSRTTYVRCFEVVYTRQENAVLQPG